MLFMNMKSLTYRLKYRFYGKQEHPYSVYERIICKNLDLNSIVLDAGCGREAPVLRKLTGNCRMPIGMDISNFGKIKDEGSIYLFVSDLANIGLIDNSIDVVITRSVLEHIKDPRKVYQEIHRVLKPDGYFIFLTPNLYDYASILAKLIPNRFHSKIVKMTEGRDEQDTFPTYYRSNTQWTIENLAKSIGFKVSSVSLLGQYPSYLMFNPLLFLLGMAYDKIVCRFQPLRFLRGWVLGVLQKD